MSRAERLPADKIYPGEGGISGHTPVNRTPLAARRLSSLKPLPEERVYIELGPEPNGSVRQKPRPPAQPPIVDRIPDEVRKTLEEEEWRMREIKKVVIREVAKLPPFLDGDLSRELKRRRGKREKRKKEPSPKHKERQPKEEKRKRPSRPKGGAAPPPPPTKNKKRG